MPFKITETIECRFEGDLKNRIENTINALNRPSDSLSDDIYKVVKEVEKDLESIVQQAFDQGRNYELFLKNSGASSHFVVGGEKS